MNRGMQNREKFWKVITEFIGEKTGEPKERVLERIAERARRIQARGRLARQSPTKRSTETPSISDHVAAKART